jgi:ketosteroid isomerase-like protein
VARVDRRVWLFAVLGALLLGYELAPREERKVLALLQGLCEKANQTRDRATLAELQNAVRAATSPNVVLRAPELADGPRGRGDLLTWSSQLLSVPLTFSLVDAEVHVEGALARVRANLLISERGSSEQHRDLRATEVNLHKSAGVWRIESIFVDPVALEKPEARP